MRYFKSVTTVENGRKKYGNLPLGFVIGHENDTLNESYFSLLDEISISENADITEITKEEYDNYISELITIRDTQRKEEIDKTIELIETKNQKIQNLENELALTNSMLLEFMESLI